jgi:polar amino acid transport system substrate-binding protein
MFCSNIFSKSFDRFRKQTFCLLSVGASFFASTAVHGDVINMVVTSNYAPYHFITKDGKPAGIHYDIISMIAAKSGHTVNINIVPRKRMEIMVSSGTSDVFPNSLDWTVDIKKFVYTDPISQVQDVVFSNTKKIVEFNSPKDLFGKSLIAIHGYHYPKLKEHFKSGKIIRLDTADESSAFSMLEANRGEGAIIVKLVGKWHIKNNKYINNYVPSKMNITNTEFRFIFNKKWAAFVPVFNAELKKLKANGSLKKIFAKY